MMKGMRTFYRIFIIIASVFVVTGCVTYISELTQTRPMDRNRTIFIFRHDDTARINKTIKETFNKFGVVFVEDKQNAELMLDYNYQCQYYMYNLVCTNFNLFITDKASAEVVLRYTYMTALPENASKIMEDMIEAVNKELSSSQQGDGVK